MLGWLREKSPRVVNAHLNICTCKRFRGDRRSAQPVHRYTVDSGFRITLNAFLRRGSKPARIGNLASRQLQLDIYGELVDSIYLYDKHGTPVSYDLWIYLRRILDWVGANWDRPDHGLREIRRDPEHFVYSIVQCWIALDRGARIARKRGLPVNRDRLRQASDSIYEAIMQGRAVGDGLPGLEGTFSICTFWTVEALSRAGRLDEARFIFETMLTYADHLGLYAEEIGPTGEALGNFPQALTHLGLINAAFELDRALGRKP